MTSVGDDSAKATSGRSGGGPARLRTSLRRWASSDHQLARDLRRDHAHDECVPIAEAPCDRGEDEHPRREERGHEDRLAARDAFALDEVERQEQHDRRLEVSVRERREAARLGAREHAPPGRDRRRGSLFERARVVAALFRRFAFRVGSERERNDRGGGERDRPRDHEADRERRDGGDPSRGERAEHVSDRNRHRIQARHGRLVSRARAREQDRLARDPRAHAERAVEEANGREARERAHPRERGDGDGAAWSPSGTASQAPPAGPR